MIKVVIDLENETISFTESTRIAGYPRKYRNFNTVRLLVYTFAERDFTYHIDEYGRHVYQKALEQKASLAA